MNRAPRISNLKNGDILIEHKEFFSDVVTVTGPAFNTTKFVCQPGRPDMFPWLSRIAHNYEKYRFEFLEVSYEPTCATSTGGTVMLAFDTDVYDEAPQTKQQAMSYQNSCRSAFWTDCVAHFTGSMIGRTLFTRYSLPADADQKTYDLGNLFLCYQQASQAGSLGELYVKYRIRLMTPQLEDPLPGSGLNYKSIIGKNFANVTDFFQNNQTTQYGNLGTFVGGASDNYSTVSYSEIGEFFVTFWLQITSSNNSGFAFTPEWSHTGSGASSHQLVNYPKDVNYWYDRTPDLSGDNSIYTVSYSFKQRITGGTVKWTFNTGQLNGLTDAANNTACVTIMPLSSQCPFGNGPPF